MKKVIITAQLIFSLVVFIVIFQEISKETPIDFTSIISLPLLFVVLITGVSQILFNTIVQGKLFSIFELSFSFSHLLKNNFISVMYLLFIPGFFAPDIYLGFVLGKEKMNYSRVISALFINRVIGLGLFISLALIALIVIGDQLKDLVKIENSNSFIFMGFGGIILGLLILLLVKKFAVNFYNKILSIYYETRLKKRILFKAILYKLGFVFVGLIGRIAIGKLLGIPLSIFEFAGIILILNMLISLPISVNGIGVREAGYVGLMVLFGVPPDKALLFAFCEFSIIIVSSIIGLIIWTKSIIDKKHLYGANLGH